MIRAGIAGRIKDVRQRTGAADRSAKTTAGGDTTTEKNESVISNRVRTEDAAKEIGCAKQYLIERIKTGEWDLGDYVKPKGAQKGTCFVFRSKLDKFLGIAERDESTKLLEDKMDKQEGV